MKRLVYLASIPGIFAMIDSASAQTAKNYTLSAPLVEELFQQLSKEPYASVAPLIGKLQSEVARQSVPPATAPAAPSPATPPSP